MENIILSKDRFTEDELAEYWGISEEIRIATSTLFGRS